MTRARCSEKPHDKGPPDERELLAAAGLSPKKAWGQNFLRDQGVLARVADASGACEDQAVVELGAGLGALTYHLVGRGGAVVAVERDRDLVPILRRSFADADNLRILEADAARLRYGELARILGMPPVVVGNLPYQLSSRILVEVANQAADVPRAVFLVQREVGNRLAAPPGGRVYGLLSVLVQRAFAVQIIARVPPSAFLPQPKVYSVVVRLERRVRRYEGSQDHALVAAARAAFSSRRKMLRSALAGALGHPRALVEQAIAGARIKPTARAEELEVADFARLGQALTEAGLLAAASGGRGSGSSGG